MSSEERCRGEVEIEDGKGEEEQRRRKEERGNRTEKDVRAEAAGCLGDGLASAGRGHSSIRRSVRSTHIQLR